MLQGLGRVRSTYHESEGNAKRVVRDFHYLFLQRPTHAGFRLAKGIAWFELQGPGRVMYFVVDLAPKRTRHRQTGIVLEPNIDLSYTVRTTRRFIKLVCLYVC